jgi:hypothetical protein
MNLERGMAGTGAVLSLDAIGKQDTFLLGKDEEEMLAQGKSAKDIKKHYDLVDKNYEEAQRLLHQLLKIYMKSTKLRTTYSSLNWNRRGNYQTVGYLGNGLTNNFKRM